MPERKIGEKTAKQTSGIVLDAVKDSDLEDVSNQDSDNNIVECVEGSYMLCFKNVCS